MTLYALLLSIISCGYAVSYASALATQKSDYTVGSMDDATAARISQLLQRNFDDDFSWNDPELAKLLYSNSNDSDSAIAKRALLDGTAFGARIGPVLSFPQCVGCSEKAADAQWTIDDFTVAFFLKTRIVPLNQLIGTCIFYGKRTDDSYKKKLKPEGLSEPATTWACATGRKTIWQLWPYNTGTTDEGNFWVIYQNKNPNTRNWLQNVWLADVEWKANNEVDDTQPNQGPINTYFSHMSAAVALSCSGVVYIMAEDVNNLPQTGIWPLVEYPVLQQQFNMIKVDALVAVPFDQDDWDKIPRSWETTNEPANWRILNLKKGPGQRIDLAHVDLNTLNWESYLDENGNPRYPDKTSNFQQRSEAVFRDRMTRLHHNGEIETRGLERRDSCLGGLPYQDPEDDWFNQ